MAFLDEAGVTILVRKLKDRFQEKLVSGTNIKTINNNSLLGSGNISIQGGGSSWTDVTSQAITASDDYELNVFENGNALHIIGIISPDSPPTFNQSFWENKAPAARSAASPAISPDGDLGYLEWNSSSIVPDFYVVGHSLFVVNALFVYTEV